MFSTPINTSSQAPNNESAPVQAEQVSENSSAEVNNVETKVEENNTEEKQN